MTSNWFRGAAVAAGLVAITGAGAAEAGSLVGDTVQVVEYYPSFGDQYGPATAPEVIPAGGFDFGHPGFSDVDVTVNGSTISVTPDGTGYGSAPFNGFDIQDLSLGTTITGIALDPSSAAFPVANLGFGAHDVWINLAASPQFATHGTVVIDLLSTNGAVGGVPEPATWAMMLFGAGLVGGGLRLARRRNELGLSGA